ncbi:MAG: AI-2E family transporter [Micrococcales bacterium]|nr:AI-2E family transporter [Micrococcales bacterium]
MTPSRKAGPGRPAASARQGTALADDAPKAKGSRPPFEAVPDDGTRWVAQPDGDSWRLVDVDPSAPRWLRKGAATSWRLIVLVAAVSLVFYATSKVLLLFVAIFLALVFAAVLRPFVQLLDKVMPRAAATGLALLTGVAVVGGMITYVVYSIVNQWEDLSSQVGAGLQRIVEWVDTSGGTVQRMGRGDHMVPPFEDKTPDDTPTAMFTVTKEQVAQWLDSAKQWLTDNAGDLVGRVAATAGTTVEVFACLALAVFCTVFFLARGDQMWQWCLGQLPVRMRDRAQAAASVGWYTFSGYTRGTLIIAGTNAFMVFWLLVIVGVPLAAPLAVLVFIGSFIPLIGAPTAMIIATIVALAALGPWHAVLICLGIAFLGQIEGHVLQPLVMGHQVSLHPVVVAVAVVGGTLTAGIFGAVVAVPLVSVAWAVFARLRPPVEQLDGEDPAGPDDDGTDEGEPPGRPQVPWSKASVWLRHLRERQKGEARA